ncbi:MAG: histidinol-phosphate transaminase [Candidatus Berkiella sp.]
MSDIHQLIRPELLAIKPFDAKRPGFDNGVLLDANESPWMHCYQEVALNRYIDEMFDPAILDPLATFYRTKPSQILLTRGSCEGIDLLVRAFCRPYQDAIVVSPPTFSIFAQCAMMQGASVIHAPLLQEQNFRLDPQLLLNSVTDHTKLVFLCTPNNPTGQLIPLEEILYITQQLQGKAMVVVDEAYMEFSAGKTAASFVEQYSNLVVLRTFSKAFGLASLRCGVVIAQPPLIAVLSAMMLPFPISLMTTQALKQAISDDNLNTMKQRISSIQQLRERFKMQLKQLPIVKKVWDSEGNFLFMQLKQSKAVLNACQEKPILVRHFVGVKGYEDCLRVSVGFAEQNEAFLQMLAEVNVTEDII